MGYCCASSCEEGFEEQQEQYFDTQEDSSFASDSSPTSPSNIDSVSNEEMSNWDSYHQQYKFWIGRLDSVKKRRNEFRKWMGVSSPSHSHREPTDRNSDDLLNFDMEAPATRRGIITDGRVLQSGASNSSNCFGMLSSSSAVDSDGDVGNLDDGSHHKRPLDLDSAKLDTDQQSQEDEDNSSTGLSKINVRKIRKRKIGWFKKLKISVNLLRQTRKRCTSIIDKTNRRVKVYPHRKKFKEFSAVYSGQDIQAHEGAITTMKFSPDGQYLASGGEDGIVRVWRVIETSWTAEAAFPEEDPSCIYFLADHKFQLNPIFTNKETKHKRKTSDAACVVIPPDMFQISEKPLHEFRDHSSNVFDLSWSENMYLLSSSADKTVRLWHIGRDDCINVFPHNDYVTCVQFNPKEERFFVSGSIDGKIRIWDTFECRVVDWINIKDIVSVICYRPNGKEIVVGCLTGICRFYSSSDNCLQLENEIYLSGKKKSPTKMITGLQFSPIEPQKLMVTCADSRITILDRSGVIRKYKGLPKAGKQMSAAFTSDGKHIISTSEDSNVYIWNSSNPSANNTAKNIWSSESFFSCNASIAIPWIEHRKCVPLSTQIFTSGREVLRDLLSTYECQCRLQSKSNFLVFGDSLKKGKGSTAIWSKEKLMLPLRGSRPTKLFKSVCKFLKNWCRNFGASSDAWGRVIVTAGQDGRIRSFCNYGLPVEI